MLPRPGKPLTKKYTETATVYHPSIYSFKCRGIYNLSSEPPNHNGPQGNHNYREGYCRGLRTKLELLADMEPGSRETAIKGFTYMTDYDLDESDANSLNQKAKSILVSPAIIFQEQNNQDVSKQQSAPLLEEELIKRQNWSCYGSTEVDMLVLKDEKDGTEHIAAVAPRNIGLSIRRIETDDGNISSIGIGFVNIVVDTGPIVDEQEQTGGRQPTTPVGQQSIHKEQQQQPATLKGEPSQPVSPPIPPRLSPVSLEGVKSYLLTVYEFSFKLGEQMKQNVNWLSGTLQDEFPSRCLSAGHKIVDEIPKTTHRTATFMGKMYDRWVNGGGDENNQE
jgi:hypothetical protein